MTKARSMPSSASRRRGSRSGAVGLWAAALAVMLLAVTIRSMPLSKLLSSSLQGLRSQGDFPSARGGEEVSVLGLLLSLGGGAGSRENREGASWGGRDAIASCEMREPSRNNFEGEKLKNSPSSLSLSLSLHSLQKP